MQDRRTGPPRILAPVAVAVFGVAFLLVLFSSGGSDDTEEESARRGESRSERRDGRDRDRAEERSIGGDTYTVRTGDTLADIARKSGKSVEDLQELNPDLDAQALVSGQKIKLRE